LELLGEGAWRLGRAHAATRTPASESGVKRIAT
jgi:hypothetical protein